ncbi:YihY/virulence factor BrkB family protein [Microbacterium sp. A1-JK]|uniref:YihY/virulence factor BrkB family protein n=1 Tax=Microbacterium sp. A1-JK TaxID=3177516 RepID=UPI00388B7054
MPKHPFQLRGETWRYVVRRTVREFAADGCADTAAGLTFFSVLSIFPAGLAVVASLGLIGGGESVVRRLFGILEQVAPGSAVDTLRDPITGFAESDLAGLTFFVALATAIWSASIYVGAFGRALNRIYGVAEGRPYWKRKPAQVALTVLLLLLVGVVAAIVVLSGPVARAVGEALSIGEVALDAWNVVRWPVLFLAVVAMVSVLFKGTSNVRQPPFAWVVLGALSAIVVFALASAGFAFYVSNFASYDRTFGTLAGTVIFLLWLFLINLALLLGAEFNAETLRGQQLQGGMPSEERTKLVLRDTAVIERTERAEQVTKQRGALLRRGVPLPPRDDTPFRRAVRRVQRAWLRVRGRSFR